VEEIIVKTQAEMDAVDLKFNGIIKVFGIGIIIKARYLYRVVARENSSVVAWGNSSVVAWENSSVVARGNSSVEAWENSSVVARENSSVVAWGNSSVVAWENSSVEAWENSSVVARGNSSVFAWGNSSVEAWGNSCIRIRGKIKTLSMFGFSVVFKPFDLKFKFKKEKTVLVQKIKPLMYLDREGIKKEKGHVILFKKTSRDFKTQEGTDNETLWTIGSTVTHPRWEPEQRECGEGKYHACSHPYFCDEFRSVSGDRYIAIRIKIVDLYEWPNAQYPHKIAFREGMVLYEVNKTGRPL
jgi:hypothetical protein